MKMGEIIDDTVAVSRLTAILCVGQRISLMADAIRTLALKST